MPLAPCPPPAFQARVHHRRTPVGLALLTALLAASTTATQASTAPKASKSPQNIPREDLPFKAVTINDSFWAPKQKIYREKTIPHSWQYVQGEIEDNEIAAGWRQAERQPGFPWSQANLYKVLETVAYSLGQENNPELDAKMDSIIKAIAAAQQPNGYVNAYFTARHLPQWTNLEGSHEGYSAGHLIEAAVAHYESTSKRNFLDVAIKLGEHMYQYFVVEKHEGVCGHAELELASVRLYRVTGNRHFLDLSKEWIERRGHDWNGRVEKSRRFYFMDDVAARDASEVTGHAVRTMFYVTGLTQVASTTNDEALKQAARRLWQSTTERKMYVVGAVGSTEKDEAFEGDYILPNKAYAESCANCGLIYFAHAMFTMDGDARSIDVLERALYNAVLHGISLDGVNTYYRNPLTDAENPRNNIWVCCPPCLSRTLLSVQNYIYAQDARGLYVNLYVGSTARFTIRNGTPGSKSTNLVEIQQQSDYPWNGAIKLNIKTASPVNFALRLRIPGWSHGAELKVNGKAILKPLVEKGYAVLSRTWKPGDTLELNLPMPVERIAANPLVQENIGQVTLQRGPLVYGVEGLDNDGNLNFELARDSKFTTAYNADLLGGVAVITGTTAAGRTLTALPFYSLANRFPSQQRVWLSLEGGVPQNPQPWTGGLYRITAN